MCPDRYHTIIITSNEKLKPFNSKGFHFNTKDQLFGERHFFVGEFL